MPNRTYRGFTLIELALVLTIIGLIVSGILVGRELIAAAAVRSQVTQIQQYQSAVNTFREKYGALPGDLNQATATKFGFTTRGSLAGQGDGNGIIEGYDSFNDGVYQAGETLFFWIDLSSANGKNVNLIDQVFSETSSQAICACGTAFTGDALYASWWPRAKIGQGNFVYVFSGGVRHSDYTIGNDGINYFGLSVPLLLYGNGSMQTAAGVTVAQAYAVDSKIDDGKPLTGNVTPFYNYSGYLAYPTNQNPDTAATCYNSATGIYSININGAALNCGLLFKFQ